AGSPAGGAADPRAGGLRGPGGGHLRFGDGTPRRFPKGDPPDGGGRLDPHGRRGEAGPGGPPTTAGDAPAGERRPSPHAGLSRCPPPRQAVYPRGAHPPGAGDPGRGFNVGSAFRSALRTASTKPRVETPMMASMSCRPRVTRSMSDHMVSARGRFVGTASMTGSRETPETVKGS